MNKLLAALVVEVGHLRCSTCPRIGVYVGGGRRFCEKHRALLPVNGQLYEDDIAKLVEEALGEPDNLDCYACVRRDD